MKSDLLAGREPDPSPSSPDAVVTIARLVKEFLGHKKQRIASHELSPLTWQQYKAVGELLVKGESGERPNAFFDRELPVSKIRPDHFQQLRARLAAKYGPVALGTRIQIVRMIFKYGRRKGLLTKDIDYGDEFNRPSKKALGTARNEMGNRCFTPDQIKALLKAAEPHMQAMIMLAINGALGPTDLAFLTPDRFDLNAGWLNYPRRKTQVFRRIPLWPETVAAVRKAIETRQPAKEAADATLLFIGKHGSSYKSDTGGHRVAHEFSNLCEGASVTGHVFYDLRRTFATIADNLSRDKDGVKAVMGHVPESEDMLDLYRQGFFDDRLRNVVDCVRGWLYAKPGKGKTESKGKAKARANKQPSAIKVEPRRRRASVAGADGPSLRVVFG